MEDVEQSPTSIVEKTRTRWVQLGVIFVAWTLVCLLVTTQTYLSIRPSVPSLSWIQLVLSRLVYWYVWALLTPGIFFLSRALPLERRRWVRPFIVHSLIATVVSVALVAYFALLIRVDPIPEAVPRTYGATFVRGLGFYFHFDFLTYWGVLAIGHTLHYYAKFRERSIRAAQLEADTARLEAQLSAAHLDALRHQIQPHFLFNTLHAISALMDADVRGARRMMARLSELLRLTLDLGGRQQIRLAEELEVAEHYLEIQRIRFTDRLQIEWEIAPEALSCLVPSLVLQPLLENAVQHGTARVEGVGQVRVSASISGTFLSLVVTDNGAGLPESAVESPRSGVGLSNVAARLEPLYGRDRATLQLKNRDSGGLRVELRFPLSPTEER